MFCANFLTVCSFFLCSVSSLADTVPFSVGLEIEPEKNDVHLVVRSSLDTWFLMEINPDRYGFWRDLGRLGVVPISPEKYLSKEKSRFGVLSQLTHTGCFVFEGRGKRYMKLRDLNLPEFIDGRLSFFIVNFSARVANYEDKGGISLGATRLFQAKFKVLKNEELNFEFVSLSEI